MICCWIGFGFMGVAPSDKGRLSLNRPGQGGHLRGSKYGVGHRHATFSRLVKKPAAAYRFLTLISFMAFLTAKRKEIEVPWNCNINERLLYRPVLDFRITLEARNPARRCLR